MHITITEKLLWEAQKLHYKKAKWILLGIFAVAFLITIPVKQTPELPMFMIRGCILGGFFGLVLHFFVSLRFQSKRIFRQQAHLLENYTVTWDNEKVYVENEHANSQLAWSSFVKVRENEQLILIYYSDVLFNMIPKSAFPDAASMAEFRSHFSKIGAS